MGSLQSHHQRKAPVRLKPSGPGLRVLVLRWRLSLGSAVLAAPALQGDVCLFPAILGGLVIFLLEWHFLLPCCLCGAGYRAAASGAWALEDH